MSIQTELTRITNAKAAIKTAIEGKGVTVPDGTMLDGMAALIQGISAGSGGGASSPVGVKDINFYDYDGTLVASYTLAEAQALTALPDGPTHDGLTFQGWNWTLDKVKALTRPMNVGAMYITDDGKTRLKIRILDTARSLVPLYFKQTVANGVTIDWGDGSDTETLSGTGYKNTAHQYTAAGEYTISLSVADGCKLSLGSSDSAYCVMGSNGNNGIVYCNLLKEVQIGENVSSIGTYAFYNCYSLTSITIPDGVTVIDLYVFIRCYSLTSVTIPDGVTVIGGRAFSGCYSLTSITIPDGVTVINSNAFDSCYSLTSITIPDGVTVIDNYIFSGLYSLASVTIPDGVTDINRNAFQYCYSLASVTIPDGVTYIDSRAFQYCCGIAEYHLKPTTPPTLSNTDAFYNIPSDCIIYVPQGCLEKYQNATNWSTYASYMQEEAA